MDTGYAYHKLDIEGLLEFYAEFVYSRAKHLGTLPLDLHHATTGMSGESGEALDITKKMWIYGQTLDTVNKEGKTHHNHLKEELGDTLFYIQHACNLLNTSIPQLLQENVDKLTKRYPVGYSDRAALERADKTGKEI